MKKTSKIFGAVALSAALAMGTAVPAFATEEAADTTNADAAKGAMDTELIETDTTNKDNVHTDVYVRAKINQLSVAVPLKVTIGLQAEGGAINAPTAGTKSGNGAGLTVTGYRLENNSAFDVKVKEISASPIADWGLVASTTNVMDAGYAITGTIGDLALTLKPSPATPGSNEGNQITTFNSGETDEIKDLSATNTDPKWRIKAKDSATGDKSIMGIQIAGKSSKLKSVSKNLNWSTGDAFHATQSEDVKAFTITYTVAADPQ